METKTINEIIVEEAYKYLEVREKPGNMGFNLSWFEKMMKLVGWSAGQSWCAYFAELVWKEAYKRYKPTMVSELDKLFSGGAVKTLQNFKANPNWVVNNEPKPGCLFIMQEVGGWRGHVGIVVELGKSIHINSFSAIEGNTNALGSREGDRVGKKTRVYASEKSKIKGQLVIVGYIHPKA